MTFADICELAARLLGTVLGYVAQHFDILQRAVRRYCFAVIFTTLCCAKVLHLYSHRRSLLPSQFLLWGPTFFLHDIIFILLARILFQHVQWNWARIATTFVSIIISLPISGMASANISFYMVTGAEIHWKKIHSFHRDAAAIRTLLTGLAGFLFVESFILTVSWFLTPCVYKVTGRFLQILYSSVRRVLCCCKRRPALEQESYGPIPFEDYDGYRADEEHLFPPDMEARPRDSGSVTLMKRLVVLGPTFVLVLLQFIRPPEPAYAFLSCTLPLSPFFADGKHRSNPVDVTGLKGDYGWLSPLTALGTPIPLNFLSGQANGFTDWEGPDHLHYNASQDPLHISNLEQDIIEPLREALHSGNVKIKHVILVKLESTRGDVFPLRKNTFMYDRIAKSYKHGHIPKDVKKRLAHLTSTARHLTGTSTGLDHEKDQKRPYGGISASNAFTTGTYTLKSVVGSICGVSPLVADFNREYKHHIYQPCIPHVLDVLNRFNNTQDNDYTSWPWQSMWMQSVTDGYDNQALLTPTMGFENITTKQTISRPNATHYPPKSKEINYYGYPDTELRDYIRDAIDSAERDHRRLFLTHLTGTTHHPWAIPGGNYTELLSYHKSYGMNRDVNRYLNSIGFVDKWLAEIIAMLEDAGVANETLLVMAGDHGISLPNDGSATPYDNPSIGSFHIPLSFSHPALPPVEITSPVIASQIVPTLFDLLIESTSLSRESTQAMKQLLPLYEGQSLIRPLLQTQNGKQDWQFTVMNTGGTWLAIRSAAKPYRLVVPLISDVEWRFTDLDRDPYELEPLLEFDLGSLAIVLRKFYGEDVIQWVNDAAHVAEWWVKENWRRWEYDPTEGS